MSENLVITWHKAEKRQSIKRKQSLIESIIDPLSVIENHSNTQKGQYISTGRYLCIYTDIEQAYGLTNHNTGYFFIRKHRV